MAEGLIEELFNFGGQWREQLSHMHSGMDQIANKFGSISRLASTFNAVILGGAFALGIDQVVKLNKALEDTKMRLAGSLGAMGFTKNFADSMRITNDLIKQNRVEAAKLPGSESDFMNAFSYTAPALKGMGMKDPSQMLSFSNKFVATALSQGIDAAQAGRDLMQMGQGRAGMDVRSFTTFKDVMGVKSTEEFNRKSATERLKLIQKVITAYGGMLGEFENTWESISSTAKSYAENTIRAFTGPSFELMKKGAKYLNDQFGAVQETVLRIGEYLGGRFADSIEGVVGYLARMLSPSGTTSNFGAAQMAAGMYGPFTSDRVTETSSGTFAGAGDTLAGLLGWVIDGFSALKPAVDATFLAFMDVGSSLWGLVAPVLPVLGQGLHFVAVVVGGLWTHLMNMVSIIADFAAPVLNVLGTAVKVVGGIFLDSLLVGAMELAKAYNWIASMIRPKFQTVLDTLSAFSDKIVELLNKIGVEWKANISAIGAGGTKPLTVDDIKADIKQSLLMKNREQFGPFLPAGMNLKPTVNMDFRGSKFDIKQAFAEGFDPDRVVTAFKADIPKNVPLESGLTPLFAVG